MITIKKNNNNNNNNNERKPPTVAQNLRTIKNFSMKEFFILTVPNTYRINQPLNRDLKNYVLNEIEIFFSDVCGGFSSSFGSGGWVNDEGESIKEDTIYYKSYFSYETEEEKNKKLNSLINFSLWVGEILKQEEITININNDIYFLTCEQWRKKEIFILDLEENLYIIDELRNIKNF
jgi:hypothetical protein